ncbi:FISUMP domain-containing protein [Psychroserpens sp. BH13MA-6]
MKFNSLFLSLFATLSVCLVSCNGDDDNTSSGWACGDTITDVDGHVYTTVAIGSDCWIQQNLNTASYNDGTAIPNVTDQTDWTQLETGAWAYYDNDVVTGQLHGKLYNWYAIENGNLCPEGWHVPTAGEYNQLVSSLGGSAIAGEKMKTTMGWNNSPDNATNSSGLSVLPSGNRDYFGGFLGLGENVWFFTASEDTNDPERALWLKVTSESNTDTGTALKKDGLPCRCVLD